MDYKKINELRNKTVIPMIFLMVFSIILMLAGVVTFSGENTNAIGFLVFILGGILLAVSTTLITKGKNKVKNILVNKVMEDKGLNGTYNAKNYIAKDVIQETKMIGRFNQYRGSDYVTFKYKGFLVDYSRLDIYMVTSSGKSTQRTPVYVGPWLMITLEKNLNQTIKIFEKQLFYKGVNNKGLIQVETESLDFNNKFAQWTTDEHFYFFIITPIMIEQLLKHEASNQGRMLFSLQNNKIHLGMHGSKVKKFKIPLFEAITEAHTKDINEDLDHIMAVIDNLKLEHDKFKK